MRHLLEFLADVLRGQRCPGCGDRTGRRVRLQTHWDIEHGGDDWSTR